MKSFRYMALVALVLLLAVVALTVEGAPPRAIAELGENWDRKVDRAALTSQREAIAKFATLANKYQGSVREAAILIRLIEAQEVAANLEFRIAHGEAHAVSKPVNLSAYKAAIQNMIDTSTRVIQRHPNFEEIVRAYHSRAYGNSELKKISEATKDYEHLTVKFPETPWAVRGNLALADFAVNVRDYKRAIYFLKRVEARPQDSHYPIALYSLAWAYFNLHDVSNALAYVSRNVYYYRDKRENDPERRLTITEKSMWEHSLRDAVTFYFEGFDKQHPDYTFEASLPRFRKLDPGDYIGNMAVLFAKLLRTRDHAKALDAWKTLIVEEEYKRPETLEVVMTNFEYVAQRRNYGQLLEAAKTFSVLDEKTDRKMREAPQYGPAQALILSTADALQKSVVGESDRAKATRMSTVLAGLYEAFAAIVDEKDPRLLQIRYNLAETLFKIKDYEGATREYAWVIERWNKKSGIVLADVRLKAISSRYQDLSKQNQLPQSLKPSPVNGEASADLGDLEKPVGEWIAWVDAYVSDFGRTPASIEEFEFEANRILYDKQQTKAAINRLIKFVKARPATKTAVASASLVLDTYVANTLWQEALEIAETFFALPTLGDADFRTRLGKIPADSYLKIIEAQFKDEKFPEVISLAEKFNKKYAASPRTPDVLFFAGLAAQKAEKPDVSNRYLTELLTKYPQTPHRAQALIARAAMAEAEYDFDTALVSYEDNLSPKNPAAAKRYFFLSWMAIHPKALDCGPFAKHDELLAVCDRYRALILLELGKTAMTDGDLLHKALKGVRENRPVWAAATLVLAKKLSFKEQLTLAVSASEGWAGLEPLQQFALFSIVNRRVPAVFSESRQAMPGLAKLKGDSGSLARRVELMKEIENAAGKVVKLPWAQAKVVVLSEIAQVYHEFCQELSRLKPPKGMGAVEARVYKKTISEILDPFEKKGKAIRTQANELAKELAVNVTGVPGAVEPPPRQPAAKAETFDLAVLDQTAAPGGWSTLTVDPKAPRETRVRAYWAEAFKTKRWGRMGYFLQELKEKEMAKEPSLTLLRAATLALAGAKQESIVELENARKDVPPEAAKVLMQLLISQYGTSSAFDKAKAVEAELAAATEVKK